MRTTKKILVAVLLIGRDWQDTVANRKELGRST